jgi:23S rRNA (guanosine2251-2'-O)-methyltransferase
VLEAFRAGRRVRELLLDEGAGLRGTLAEVVEQATRQDVPLTRSPRQELDRLTLTGTHQGILAWAEPRDEGTVQSTLDELQESGATPFLLLVDQVQYEQNLGAILRTAEAAGVQAVIVPKSHNALLTPVVRRISAGASEHLPLVRESPMAALAAMRRAGLRIVGADEHAPAGFDEADLTGPIALVLGGEHKGLSEPVRARCDLLVSVPMRGRTPSLNVSVAAALLLYERVRQERAQQRRRAATIAPPPFEPDPD